MKNYIYEPMWTQDLEDMIEADKARPLIMEMFYKYGLRVYAVTSSATMLEWIEGEEKKVTKSRLRYMMTLDGLPYCQVYANEHSDGKVDYCFYSPYFEKQRGRDRNDKRTIRASKISGLMRMLDKYSCVMDSPERVLEPSSIKNAGGNMYYRISENTRHNPVPNIDKDNVMLLAKAYFNGEKLKPEANQQIKEWFDKRTEWEHTERQSSDRVKSTLGNEFYILAESYQDFGICIGKGRLNFTGESVRDAEFEVTDSFQRVPNISDYSNYDELKAPLTMYKIYMEDKYPSQMQLLSNINKIISNYGGGYSEDLNMLNLNMGSNSDSFSMSILVIPV